MSDQTASSEQDLTLRDYVRVIFRQKFIVFTSVIVIMSVVLVGLALRTPVYQASVKMLISGEKQLDSPDFKEMMTMQDSEVSLTQSEIVISEPVLRRVVDSLRLYNDPLDYEYKFASPLKQEILDYLKEHLKPKTIVLSGINQSVFRYQMALENLRSNIKVEPIKETNIFTINVKDYDPVKAEILANLVSRSYVIFDLEQQLAELQQKYGDKHPMFLQLQNNIERMTRLLTSSNITNADALASENVKIVEQASVPLKPYGINNKILALAALFASLFMGILLAFLFEYMDQSIKSPNDVEQFLGIPVIGTVPVIWWFKRIPKRYNIVFQNLANQLRLMMTLKNFKTVLVTSINKDEGTTMVISQLAKHIAQREAKKVLIIDANFHHSAMHKFFKIPQGPGLVDVLTQDSTLEDAIKVVEPSLFILPAGETTFNPMIFLDSPRTFAIIDKLKKQFDLVLVDCNDNNSSQIACLLAYYIEKTILVLSENKTRRPVAARALANLKEHKASILGAILNKRTYPIPRFVYNRV